MKYIFSVIVPIYNLDKYIEDAIQCVLNQTIGFEENIQLILVDDGSTDYSGSICKKYAADFPDNIVYIYQKNQGASAARNAGLQYVDSKYLLFFDGDDLWEEDAFEKMESFFDEHYEEIDVVGCRIKKFEKSEEFTVLDYRFDQGSRIVDIKSNPGMIHVNVTSSIIKTSAIKDLRFDTRLQFGEDAKFLAMLIAQKGKYGLLKEVVYHYRKRFDGTSLSQSAINNVKRFVDTSEYYYKGLYQYSIKTYGRVLAYFQHLIVNALRFRAVMPVPQNLTEAQAAQYCENIMWVIKHTNDSVFLRMKFGLRNTRLYMLWLKHGDTLYEDLKFVDGTVYYKNAPVGMKLGPEGILRVDDVIEGAERIKYYGAVQLSSFIPEPKVRAEFSDGIREVELKAAPERSRKSFTGDPLHQVYTWEVELDKDEAFPEFIMDIDGFELSLVPFFYTDKTKKNPEEPHMSDDFYTDKIAQITDSTHDQTEIKLKCIRTCMNVSFEDCYHYGLYDMTEPQKARISKRVINQRNFRKSLLDKVITDTGLTENQIESRIKWINRRNIYHVTLSPYSKFELYKFKGKELDEKLLLLAERGRLKEELNQKFKSIDNGQLKYDDVYDSINRIYAIYEKLIPESLINKYAERIRNSFPELASDAEKMKTIAADIEFSVFVLGFYVNEYITYRFAEKTLEEKREFISETELIKVYREIHNDDVYDLFNDKGKTYNLLKKYYGRDIIKGRFDKQKTDFIQFCKGKDAFVFKPAYGSMGKGIRLIKLTDHTDPGQIFDELNDKYGEWIAEDVIKQHESTRIFNPDSVNTVRLIAYYDGRKIVLQRAFAKVGRVGSFVDNGGSGGILISIDHKTGEFNSDGCDENGIKYDKHPDTGIVFNGYKLPKWRKALRIARKATKRVSGAKYIGWDLALTEDGKWIIVEGNSRPQFMGQQCTTGVGEKRIFKKIFNRKEI